jgi:hypothetical protein
MQSGLNMNFSVVFGRNERRFLPSEVDGVSSNGVELDERVRFLVNFW